ncbi:MAG: potassium/proton antiporter [Candidatus Kapaibacterium sp.]
MVLTIENILLVGSLLLFISVIAGKTSYRFGVPTLILFLAVGMLAGSEGVGGISFNDPTLAQFIGVVALNFILFSGGLDTNWNSVKPILWQGVSLSTIGVLLTAISLGIFISYISDLSIYESLLLGSIVSSTDAAAVFSILRSRSLALKPHIRPTLELESGSNDPMAYVLTIGFLSLLLNPEREWYSMILPFFQQMILGGLGGYLFGRLSKYVINSIKLDYEGLYIVLVISLMFATFSATDFLGGNGFLAVYLTALYLGNQDLLHKKTILKMFDGLAWLMQIVLFLTLGLLVFPSEIINVSFLGLSISLFLIFIARPLSVYISLIPFKLKYKIRNYISWVGLRGAVPIVFATYPLLAGIDKADLIFNIVFFISLTSILLQGTSLSIVAKWLKVAIPEKVKPISPIELQLNDRVKTVMEEIEIPESTFPVSKKIVDLNFPKTAIIAMINRNNNFLTPSGSTLIQAHDILIVLSENRESVDAVYESLQLERVSG